MSTLQIALVIVLIVLVYYYVAGSVGPPNPVTWMNKHGYIQHTGKVEKAECPAGSYISNLNGYGGDYVNGLGIKCSNGTKFGPFGGQTGNPYTVDSPAGGWDSIYGQAGWYNNTVMGLGNPSSGGAKYTDKCPAGQKITSMEVDSDGNIIGGLKFGCGAV